jgi:hypothetical protein
MPWRLRHSILSRILLPQNRSELSQLVAVVAPFLVALWALGSSGCWWSACTDGTSRLADDANAVLSDLWGSPHVGTTTAGNVKDECGESCAGSDGRQLIG